MSLNPLFLAVLALTAQAASATEIESGTINFEATLGSAYKSDKELMVADSCVGGVAPIETGVATAGFTFQNSMSESQLSSELGIGFTGRAKSGAVSYGASADFMRNAVSNSLSVSSAWQSSYTFPVSKLIGPTLTEVGKLVEKDDERWNTTCGDEYVNEIVRGAKLFFSIRVDFTSKTEKDAFSASFSVSGPMASVSATLKTASQSFSRRTKVTVAAHQIGGDVSKITDLFEPGPDGKKNFVECTLGSFEKCAQVIQAALAYATDTSKGFPSQLAPGASPGPATLKYRTAPYTAIGIYPKFYPFLTEAIKLSRQELTNVFAKHYRWAVTAMRMLQQSYLGTRRAVIEAEKELVDRNILAILAASQVCYDTPMDCPEYVQNKLKLEPVNELAFLPPEFKTLCEDARKPGAPYELTQTLNRLIPQMGGDTLDCELLGARVLDITQVSLKGANNPGDHVDVRLLQTLTNVTQLDLSGARLTDISPLGDLIYLKSLNLSKNRIQELEPLTDMVDLLYLNLSGNLVSSVSSLAGLQSLQWLYLQENRLTSLEDLVFFPRLLAADLTGNQLSWKDVKEFRDRMPTNAFITHSAVDPSPVP